MITYAAINLTNKKFQVGSTTNFERRCKEHHCEKGNLEFQRSLRKDPENFYWIVGEDDGLGTRDEEQYYLDFYHGTAWCYNHNPSASAPPSPKGRTWKQRPEKIRRGTNHPSYGKRHKQETIELMKSQRQGEKHPSAKKTRITHVKTGVAEVFNYLEEGAIKYGVCASNLRAVARGVRKSAGGYTAEYI